MSEIFRKENEKPGKNGKNTTQGKRKMRARAQKVLVYNPELCTGCTYCMTACSYKHYGIASFEKSFIRIIEDPKKEFSFLSAFCAHCETAACVAACPSDAMHKEDGTGIIRVNSMLCIMCKNCRVACPISHPDYDEDLHQAVKCDQCDGNPICVQQCPTGAITYANRIEARKNYGVIKDV